MNTKNDRKPVPKEQANNTLGIDGLSTHPNVPSKRTNNELPIEFGRYRLLKVLGEGGMGAVYLAHDIELDRKVALKLPHFVGGKSKDQGERFRREARLAANLSHPNICRIHDIGEHDAQMYLTMEYIEGKTLNDIIKAKGAVEPRTAVNLVKRIASAVQLAHTQGIIHRDLKPANIMIKKDRDFVIMDFGLARRVEQEEVQLTATGAVLGTPAYMAPEQLRGENNAVGPQSDVYSLGVILYELLTGQRPFQGTLPQIYAQVLSTDSVSPSSIKTGLDSALDEICRKATSANTGMRYRTAEEFSKALAGYVSGQSQAPFDALASVPAIAAINAPLASYQPTIKKPKSVLTTYRKPIAIGAIVGLAVLVFLGAFLVRRSSTQTVDDSLVHNEVTPPAKQAPTPTPSTTLAHMTPPNTSPPVASIGQSFLASTTESPNATSGQEQENNTKATSAQNDEQPPGLVWSSPPGKTRWWSACYSPAGNFIAAGEQNPAIQQPQSAPIRVWPLSSDQNGNDSIVLQHPVANSRISSLVFSSDGKLMASGTGNGSIALWDMESTSPTMLTSFQRFDATVFGMAFSPDGRYFASGSVKTSTPVIVWDIADPKKPKEAFKLTLPAPDSPCSFDFSIDSKTLFISSGAKEQAGHLFGWSFKTEKVAKLLWTGPAQANSSFPRAINLSPDGTQIAIAHGTQCLVLQADTGKQVVSFGGHASIVQAIDWTPDGSECYSASYDQTIRRWQVADGVETWRNDAATGRNEGLGVSADGKFGVSSGYDMKDDTLNVVQFWRLPKVLMEKSHPSAASTQILSRNQESISLPKAANESAWRTNIESAQKANAAGDYETAERMAALAEQEADAFPDDDTRRSQAWYLIASLSQNQFNFVKAEGYFDKCLQLASKNKNQLVLAHACSLKAAHYKMRGMVNDAELLFKQAVSIRESTSGADNWETANALRELADLYRDNNRIPAADALYARAYESLAKTDQYLRTANCATSMAESYLRQGNLAQCESSIRSALQLYENQVKNAPDLNLALGYRIMAELLRKQKKLSLSNEYYSKLSALLKNCKVEDIRFQQIVMDAVSNLREQRKEAEAKDLEEKFQSFMTKYKTSIEESGNRNAISLGASVDGKPGATVTTDAEATAKAMKAIQGEWKCIAGEEIGKILDKIVVKEQDRRITIKGNSYTMKRTENGTRRAQTGKFEIDAVSGNFDFIGKEQSGAAREIVGIYELDGDTLKLCYRYKINSDCVRPTKFKTDGEGPNICIFYTYKRDND